MEYSVELNNAKRDDTFSSGRVTQKSPVVEVFSAMADGRPLDGLHLGKKADAAASYIMDLGSKASAGSQAAISELNEIRKFVIQPRLLQEVRLLGLFGSYTQLGWGETAYLERVSYENVRADIQAEGQDVSTPFVRKTKTALAPVTISAGHKVNYREIALGDMESEGTLIEQVHTAMRNKAVAYVVETIYKAVESASGVKYFYEGSGLVKTNVDDLLAKIRRYGKPNVSGDYAVLAQFLPWIGYAGTVDAKDIVGVSQKLLDEIADTGIVGKYNGAVLTEIPNGYDYSRLTEDGTNYETVLPAGLAFVTPAVPAGGVAPVQTFGIGGLTAFSGTSVATGEVMSRYDLGIACGVAAPDQIGIIHDTDLDALDGQD